MSAGNDTITDSVFEGRRTVDRRRYAVLLPLVISAVPCYLFNFYHLLSSATLRNTIHHHAVALLLTTNFLMVVMDLPILLNKYIKGAFSPATDHFCYFWMFIDYYLFVTGLLGMTFASFERHILTFHRYFSNTRRKRLFIHYLPLLFCVLYPLCYYIWVLFIYPCKNYYDPKTQRCSDACYLYADENLALYEYIMHGTLPTLLIALFSVTLWIRVLRQRQRVHRAIDWNRNRKFTIQMLGISSFYLVTNLPLCIVIIVQLSGIPDFGSQLVPYLIMAVYMNPTMFPFIYLASLPELRKKLPWCQRRRRVAVAPAGDLRRTLPASMEKRGTGDLT